MLTADLHAQNRRTRIYWSFTGVAAAILMSFVAPAVYGARSASSVDGRRLGSSTDSAARPLDAALLTGAEPSAEPAIADPHSRRRGSRSQTRPPQNSAAPLLWVGGEMTNEMAGDQDPGTVLPPYESTVTPSSTNGPSQHGAPPPGSTTTLSDTSSLLLGDRVVKGVATFQHSVLGGPEPGLYRAPHPFHLRPRFADGGVQGAVTWSF